MHPLIIHSPQAVKLLLQFNAKLFADGAVFTCSEDEEICAEEEGQTQKTVTIFHPFGRLENIYIYI